MKKIWFALGALVIVVATLILSISRQSSGGIAITQRIAISKNYASAVPFGQNTLLYSDDQKLLAYNYQTGASRAISPDIGVDGLKNSDSFAVSSDKKFILFRNVYATPGGTLSNEIRKAGLDSGQGYWWVYSVEAQHFTLLPQSSITVAKLSGGRLYTLTYGESGNAITSYELASLKQLSSLSIPPMVDFFILRSGLLLESDSGALYTTKDGVVSDRVAESTDVFAVSADQQTAFGITKTGQNNLVAVDLQSGRTSTIAQKLVGAPVFDGSDAVLYATGAQKSNKLTLYSLTTHKTTLWVIPEVLLPKNASFVPQTLLGEQTAVVADTSGAYYLVGNHLKTTK